MHSPKFCSGRPTSYSGPEKDDLIQELEAQLARLQSPTKAGSSWTLQFLTREAADDEKKVLLEENKRLKEAIKQRDATIASKEKQISEALEEGTSYILGSPR